MTVHAQAQELLDQIALAATPALHTLSVRDARRAAGDFNLLSGAADEVSGVVVNRRFIPGPTADLPVAIYTPKHDRPLGAFVYFHGGGWVFSNIDAIDTALRIIASKAGCVAIAVNYQKAPEHRFPIPLDDCFSSVKWVVDNATELDVDVARVAVGGDSAGGNLAAAVCIRSARAQVQPEIAMQVLLYPALDSSCSSRSHTEFATGFLCESETVRWLWRQYLGDDADSTDALASPLNAEAEILPRLPPALIITAENDPLRDDGEAYAGLLERAGVPVNLTRYQGMIHGFFTLAGVLDDAHKAYEEVSNELRALIG